jgi:hypothetical protein
VCLDVVRCHPNCDCSAAVIVGWADSRWRASDGASEQVKKVSGGLRLFGGPVGFCGPVWKHQDVESINGVAIGDVLRS